MATTWIGPDDALKEGDIGFLIEKTNTMRGGTSFQFRDVPAHTNQAHEPRLHGWCGTYNDLATYGRGLVVVTRVARNGRALVQELDGDKLKAGLEELGYPELMPTE
jgi:hypothetical protein